MTLPRAVLGLTLCLFLLGLLAVADPRVTVQLPEPLSEAATAQRRLVLGPDGDFQKALREAVSGDVIELQAGAVYEGPFVLGTHAGPGWVTIISSVNPQNPLPPAGTRVTPRHASAMASLVSATGAVIRTDPGAARYRFVGIEIRPVAPEGAPGSVRDRARVLTNLVLLSAADNDAEDMPHHIVFERSYLHGDPVQGTRRGIVMNGAHMALIDSHLSDFKSTEDSQAVAGWEGTGPFLIRNNYLEAAGENVMFGGADPRVKGRIPSDIDILGNHFSKPLAWRQGHATHDGSDWTIKNLLELKNARRVRIDGNLLEHNWPQAQNGFAILFTVRNQEGGSPWSLVEDVQFSNNIVRRVGSAINILGRDDNYPSGRTQNVLILNNLFYEIGAPWGQGHLLQLLDSPARITLTHNTALQSAAILMMDGPPTEGVQIRGNVFMENAAGFSGTDAAPGQQSVDAYLAAPLQIEGNVLIGTGDARYPPGMTRVAALDSLALVDPLAGDVRQRDASASVQDATAPPPGVDVALLCTALSLTERPLYC